jgi:predicted nucleotidyltransferase component of viral defense system
MKKERDPKSPDSVLKRLSNQRLEGQTVQNAQILFVLERFLARVARSRYRDQLVLKGGILLYLMTQRWNRPTEDLDLLALRIPGEDLEAVLAEILSIDLGDRLEFQAHLMKWEEIREDTGYPCRRFTIPFRFGPRHAHRLKLDLSFGDPITPGPRLIEVHPMLEDFEQELVLGYPLETFLAEKVETLLVRGLVSTRAKDLFDLWVVARTSLNLELNAVAAALRTTADYRAERAGRSDSVLRMDANALMPVYGTDPGLKKVWDAYVRSKKLVTPTYAEVVEEVQPFITPMVERSMNPGGTSRWNLSSRRWE